MPFNATVLRVIVASPGDVLPERDLACQVVHLWNAQHAEDKETVLLPVRWEIDAVPAFGERAQDIINRQIVMNSDILLAFFWTRLGTPTGKEASGTVEEIRLFAAARKPVLIYFSSAPLPAKVDIRQYRALLAFKKQARMKALLWEYSTIEGLGLSLMAHLNRVVCERPTSGVSQNWDRELPAATGEEAQLDRRIFDAWLRGWTLDQIASDVHVTRIYVWKILSAHGISLPREAAE